MRKVLGFGAATLVLSALVASCASGGSGGGALQAEFTRDIQPILAANCAGCHNATAGAGGVTLAFANLAEARQRDAAFWTRVSNAITSGRMPPPTAARRPSDAERQRLVAWIGEHLVN